MESTMNGMENGEGLLIYNILDWNNDRGVDKGQVEHVHEHLP